MQKRPVTPEVALSRLQSLCVKAEHCSFELKSKLRTWGISGADAERIMESLEENRFCNDRRYAESLVHDKATFSHWGRRKIAAALYAKRIPRDIIDEAMEVIDSEAYEASLEELARAKARQLDSLKIYDERVRLFRFLASRGFEPALISAVIKRLASK